MIYFERNVYVLAATAHTNPEESFVEALFPLLRCARDWSVGAVSGDLTRVYQLLRAWGNLHQPERALRFLTMDFPDCEVRRYAVRQLERLSDDQLILYLPQLIQVG